MASYEIDSVRKAIAVLQALAGKGSGAGVSELARELGLTKTSVFRLLQTLAEQGFVKQDLETRRYRLGSELVVLGQAASEAIDFRADAKPVMTRLSEETGLPTYLNVAGTNEVVCLEHVASLAGIDLYGRAGHTMPYHACPSGLVLLAYGPDELVERIVRRGLVRYARNTIGDRQALEAELDRVRLQGYAFAVDDLEDGVTSVSAPITDATGSVIGALGLAGFSHLFDGRVEELIEKVRVSAALVSDGGCQPLEVRR